jgi:MscS family membrane protein
MAGSIYCAPFYAQEIPNPPAPAPVTQPQDPLGRTSPRGTVIGFLEAAHRGDLATAAQYLQMPEKDRRRSGSETAHQLQVLMDRSFSGHVSTITDRPEGRLGFTSAAGREKIGALQVEENQVDVILVRVPGEGGVQIWIFATETLNEVPDLFDQLPMNSIEQHLWPSLVNKQFLGAPLWIWLGMLLLIPVALALSWLLVVLALAPERIWLHYRRRQEVPSKWWQVPTPAWFIVAVFIHRIAVVAMGIPFLYRFYYGRFVLVLFDFGVAWAVWRVISWSGKRAQNRAIAQGKALTTSFLVLGQRVAKAVVLIVAALVILSTLGVNTSAALAGLGIGGIAIAFASQKTLENLFGGALVLGDRTIRLGDYVRLGSIEGTVEDVSLRATRIRTLARTQVSVPNGTLATMNVENLTVRDKILFQATLGLRRETTADQLRFVLAEIRRMLYSHSHVETGTARVRFVALGDSSLDIEVYSYVLTRDFNVFLAVREDLLLRILDIIASAGSALAMPSQTLYMSQDSGVDEDKKASTHAQVAKWREENMLPFPDFHPDAVSGMRNSIEYPDSKSAARKK